MDSRFCDGGGNFVTAVRKERLAAKGSCSKNGMEVQ